jgi:hypothetical protein
MAFGGQVNNAAQPLIERIAQPCGESLGGYSSFFILETGLEWVKALKCNSGMAPFGMFLP